MKHRREFILTSLFSQSDLVLIELIEVQVREQGRQVTNHLFFYHGNFAGCLARNLCKLLKAKEAIIWHTDSLAVLGVSNLL